MASTRTERCSVRSETLHEPMLGTASTVRDWLLVEHPGPWGRRPLNGDARMPRATMEALDRLHIEFGVRVLLIRRVDRSRVEGVRCYAVHSGPDEPWIEHITAPSIEALPLGVVAPGRRPGWFDVDDALFVVCTHGRRDPCCAERGRPLAHGMARTLGDSVWEGTHVGGDRFAGNVVAFPHGLYFGRLTPERGTLAGRAYAEGRIDLASFRGRSCYAMDVQAAEQFLRADLVLDGVDEVRPVHARRSGDRVDVWFAHPAPGPVTHRVRMHRDTDPPRLLTCHSERALPPPRYRLVDLSTVSG